MIAHSPNTSHTTESSLRRQIEQQWNENQYAVSVNRLTLRSNVVARTRGF